MASMEKKTSLIGSGLISGVNRKADSPAGTGLICGLNQKADQPDWAWPNPWCESNNRVACWYCPNLWSQSKAHQPGWAWPNEWIQSVESIEKKTSCVGLA